MTSFAACRALRSYWYPLAAADAVSESPLSVRLLGEAFVVWRSESGDLCAALDRCPHREAPLSLGVRRSDGCLVCPYHGWVYDRSGRCVSVPSSGDGAVPSRARLHAVHVAERYGLVWIAPDEPVVAIPVIAQDDDPAFRRINQPVERWRASTTRMVDNFLDIAHFDYVHLATFGGNGGAVPHVELERLDDDFYGYRYDVVARNTDAEAVVVSGQTTATVERSMTTGFSLPFLVRSTVTYADGLEHVLLLCSTPIDDDTSVFTFVVWRNDDFTTDGFAITEFDRRIGAEDRAMLERIPGPLSLGATDLVNVQADRAGVEWRRRLRELIER
ncbi:MAG: Rieske 2Fe-2S domain-containing protein [Acidimicrobiia bacterium]